MLNALLSYDATELYNNVAANYEVADANGETLSPEQAQTFLLFELLQKAHQEIAHRDELIQRTIEAMQAKAQTPVALARAEGWDDAIEHVKSKALLNPEQYNELLEENPHR